jgi:hypothetical protein
MGMSTSRVNPIFNFSHIAQASFSEFVIDGHYYTSPNQQKPPGPPTLSFSDSKSLTEHVSPTILHKRLWALHNHPYLPYVLNSPFRCAMTTRLATPPELILLDDDKNGWHLPGHVAKSWKSLEQSCRQVASVLLTSFKRDHPKTILNCSPPPNPSNFGYFKAHSSKEKARSALSESLDAFVVLFAYVSFCIAICRTSDDPLSVSLSTAKPRWFRDLSSERHQRFHPEWLQLLSDSPIADFTTVPQRLGMIINVARCSWLRLVPYMLKTNIPIWLYWGVPPAFGQPLDTGA